MNVFDIKDVKDIPLNQWFTTDLYNSWYVYIKSYNGHYMVKTKPCVRNTPTEEEIKILNDDEIWHIYTVCDKYNTNHNNKAGVIGTPMREANEFKWRMQEWGKK